MSNFQKPSDAPPAAVEKRGLGSPSGSPSDEMSKLASPVVSRGDELNTNTVVAGRTQVISIFERKRPK
jgi:hypothetical protein